jgi:NAD(P)-dependent dehydrogenase (short-subunit alcohol dehydrogenase family)
MKIAQQFNLAGKVAMISGGGDGIGRAITEALAQAGADIVVFSRRAQMCEEAAHAAERFGVRTLALGCDITVPQSVQHLISTTVDTFNHIDILINNAGRTWGASPEEITDEAWDKVIELNLSATFRLTRDVGIAMIRQESGKIINISSYAGAGGTDPVYLNALPYNTTKGAINAFTKDLAVKWARHGIQVNAVAPGWFPTRMTEWTFTHNGDAILADIPMGRYGRLEEIGGIVVFLSSPASDYITGQVIGVDGGLSAW